MVPEGGLLIHDRSHLREFVLEPDDDYVGPFPKLTPSRHLGDRRHAAATTRRLTTASLSGLDRLAD
jgi:hypothetical protein